MVAPVSGCVLATGNDDGEVRVWDMRLPDSVASFNCHTDYISAMISVEKANSLLACSSDGTLSVMDLRAHKVHPALVRFVSALTSSGLNLQNEGESRRKCARARGGEFDVRERGGEEEGGDIWYVPCRASP